jgi:phage anti-repressor protein
VQDIGIQSGVAVDGKTIQTVDARRLHGFLQSSQDFSNWITARIAKYGFVNGQDFTTITGVSNNSSENPKGGRPPTDYHVSLDMAKELAMVERTDKGREARKYFIECEKKFAGSSASGTSTNAPNAL